MSRILIIEDDQVIANAFLNSLIDSGFDAIIAQDAYQGTKLVYDKNPDLIILDLMLPAGGGQTVLKNIRLSMKTKNIPVIILTGVQDEELKNKIIKEGVSAYMEKPVELDKLIAAIKNILGVSKNSQP
jgi:DNA-binding response OmpR family regulator